MSSETDTIIEYLREAHTAEQAGVAMLSGHLRGTPPGPYRTWLRAHLDETQRHVARLEDRLHDLGASRGLIGSSVTALERVVGQLAGVALGPVNFLVSRDRADAVLRDARDELAAEAREMATYRGLGALARAGGDTTTAALADAILDEEQRAYDRLSELLDGLVARVARERFGDVAPEAQSSPRGGRPDAAPQASDEGADDEEADEDDARGEGSSDDAPAARNGGPVPSFVPSHDGPTRGQAAALREAEREAEATDDSPGAEIHVDEPWEGYAKMTAAQIVDRLRDVDPTVIAMVRLYEGQNKGRKAVLHATEG